MAIMNKVLRRVFKWNFIILVLIAVALSACTINVNLHVATDKPIALNVAVDKPIEVKLGADVAVTKLPPIQAEAKIGITNPLISKAKP